MNLRSICERGETRQREECLKRGHRAVRSCDLTSHLENPLKRACAIGEGNQDLYLDPAIKNRHTLQAGFCESGLRRLPGRLGKRREDIVHLRVMRRERLRHHRSVQPQLLG